ncbi:transglycosylase domain-containing protein, partial [Escherichia sp. TWPC-MK]
FGQNFDFFRVISGGSTLTMQVARLLDPHPKTFGGKIRQLWRALQLEWHLSKREILTLYLNRAPFGGTLQGIGAASWALAAKPPALPPRNSLNSQATFR